MQNPDESTQLSPAPISFSPSDLTGAPASIPPDGTISEDSPLTAEDLNEIAAELDVDVEAPPAAEELESLQIQSTNFRLTSMINAIAGNNANQGWDAVDHQIKIIESEFNELCDGIKARDVGELRDGIMDLLFTVYGLAHRAGIDADADFLEVVRSNMFKFDANEEDCMLTAEKYSQQGVSTNAFIMRDTEANRVYYITRSAKDQNDHREKFLPAGKWLKSHNFEEPQYEPLPIETQVMLRTGDGQAVVHPAIAVIQAKIVAVEELLVAAGYPKVYVQLAYDAPGTEQEIADNIVAMLKSYETVGVEGNGDAYQLMATMLGNGEVTISVLEAAEPVVSAEHPRAAETRIKNGVVATLLTERGFAIKDVNIADDNNDSAEEIADVARRAIEEAVGLQIATITVTGVIMAVYENLDIAFSIEGINSDTQEVITFEALSTERGHNIALPDPMDDQDQTYHSLEGPAANDDNAG